MSTDPAPVPTAPKMDINLLCSVTATLISGGSGQPDLVAITDERMNLFMDVAVRIINTANARFP